MELITLVNSARLGPGYAAASIVLSAILFGVLGEVVKPWIPARAKSEWKFKNILLSLVHATFSGAGALACIYNNQDMAKDVINTYDNPSLILVCFSLGYFIYDSVDMLVYSRHRESFELLAHHIVIFVCFGIAVVTRQYVGYAVIALLAEVNSIFLHVRQLLTICRIAKDAVLYRTNSLINLATYIAFRIVTFAWMTRWLVYNRDNLPIALFTVGSIGLAVITGMNIVLFYRLLKSDFFHSSRRDGKNE